MSEKVFILERAKFTVVGARWEEERGIIGVYSADQIDLAKSHARHYESVVIGEEVQLAWRLDERFEVNDECLTTRPQRDTLAIMPGDVDWTLMPWWVNQFMGGNLSASPDGDDEESEDAEE